MNSHMKFPRAVLLLTNDKGQSIFAFLTFCIVVVYIASFVIFAPNDGIRLHSGFGGKVFEVMEGRAAEEAGIEPEDLILTIDGQPVDQWLRRPLYRPGVGEGDIVIYGIQRGDKIFTIPVRMKSYLDNIDDFVVVSGVVFIALVFWVTGVLLSLFVPPNDLRARLLLSFR